MDVSACVCVHTWMYLRVFVCIHVYTRIYNTHTCSFRRARARKHTHTHTHSYPPSNPATHPTKHTDTQTHTHHTNQLRSYPPQCTVPRTSQTLFVCGVCAACVRVRVCHTIRTNAVLLVTHYTQSEENGDVRDERRRS